MNSIGINMMSRPIQGCRDAARRPPIPKSHRFSAGDPGMKALNHVCASVGYVKLQAPMSRDQVAKVPAVPCPTISVAAVMFLIRQN